MCKIKIVHKESKLNPLVVAVVKHIVSDREIGTILKHKDIYEFIPSDSLITWKITELEEIIDFCKDENIKIPKVPESDLFVLMEGSKH